MSEVSYHGWTHRPKAQGGTDPIPAAGGGTSAATVVSLDILTSSVIPNNIWTLAVPGDGSREWAGGWRSDSSWIVDLDSAGSIERDENAHYVAHAWANFSDSVAGDKLGVAIQWRNDGALFFPTVKVAVSTDEIIVVTSHFWGIPSPATAMKVYCSPSRNITAAELVVRRYELDSDGELLP